MLTITEIGNDSFNNKNFLQKGDKIIRYNGFLCQDILDYYYFDSENVIDLEIERSGKTISVLIKKDEDESLLLDFENDNLETKTCRNDCIFCFVKQMPKGLRESLYLKDDDYRTSFLFGSYVTLTNCTDSDIQRIIRLHLSPLYISVHSTDEEVRRKLLNNRFAGKINNYLKTLNDAGIIMHAQVVLVKGVNDGDILRKTCYDLARLENVLSLAVVPCGITKFRENLTKIEDIDSDYASSVIKEIKNINSELGKNFVLPADEFYIKARLTEEKSEFYEDYCQIENGVGLISYFKETYPENAVKSTYKRTFLIVTGVSAYGIIQEYAKKTEQNTRGLKIYVLPCENKFFGPSVTCAGLLVGGDILQAVNNFDKPFDELCLSDAMLKEGETVFLDGMTLKQLSQKIGKPIRVVGSDGSDFYSKLTGDCEYIYE